MKSLIVLTICICLIACTFKKKVLFIDSIDLSFSIENLDENNYRIYINKGLSDSCADYIDVYYNSSDMPCMTLYFPHGNSDTIYIREDSGIVKRYQSKDFHIIVPKYVITDSNNENNYLHEWTDSVFLKELCTSIQFDECMSGISVWNEEGKFQYDLKR